MVGNQPAGAGGDRPSSGEWGSLSQNRERADELVQRIRESADRASEALRAARSRLEQAREPIAGLERSDHSSLANQYTGEFADPKIRAEYEAYLDEYDRLYPSPDFG